MEHDQWQWIMDIEKGTLALKFLCTGSQNFIGINKKKITENINTDIIILFLCIMIFYYNLIIKFDDNLLFSL